MADDTRPPYQVANDFANRKDEFSELRQNLSEHINRIGGRVWIDRHLAIKDIEDLIDAKIAAALRDR